jgi:rhodanese-related sulfurtransferase
MGDEFGVVNADEAAVLLAEGALALDVRELDEFDAGHAPQALHIPLSSVPDHLSELARDQVIVCVCRSGGRSARAAAFLVQQGFDARNLTGGMLAWQASGEELVATEGSPVVL